LLVARAFLAVRAVRALGVVIDEAATVVGDFEGQLRSVFDEAYPQLLASA
jgi:hypothetical protein